MPSEDQAQRAGPTHEPPGHAREVTSAYGARVPGRPRAEGGTSTLSALTPSRRAGPRRTGPHTARCSAATSAGDCQRQQASSGRPTSFAPCPSPTLLTAHWPHSRGPGTRSSRPRPGRGGFCDRITLNTLPSLQPPAFNVEFHFEGLGR